MYMDGNDVDFLFSAECIVQTLYNTTCILTQVETETQKRPLEIIHEQGDQGVKGVGPSQK